MSTTATSTDNPKAPAETVTVAVHEIVFAVIVGPAQMLVRRHGGDLGGFSPDPGQRVDPRWWIDMPHGVVCAADDTGCNGKHGMHRRLFDDRESATRAAIELCQAMIAYDRAVGLAEDALNTVLDRTCYQPAPASARAEAAV